MYEDEAVILLTMLIKYFEVESEYVYRTIYNNIMLIYLNCYYKQNVTCFNRTLSYWL